MRGKAQSAYSGYNGIRITPAYAGKSQTGGIPSSGTRDHPRVCGEKLICASKSPAFWGSPPRMRGKEARFKVSFGGNRITPAYAGKRDLQS